MIKMTGNRPPRTERRAARLLVLDPESGAVLLCQYEDGGRRWWATPGGGVEGDETFAEAAAREAMEELALPSPTLVPLWLRTSEFTFRGKAIRQNEQFFLLRVAAKEIEPGYAVQEAHRHEGILGLRWWLPGEIEATSEQVYPEDLPERLRELRDAT